MDKKILFLLMVILLVGFVSADSNLQTLGTYQSGSTINLVQNCVNSTYSNITRITYPNGTFIINSQTAMTKNGYDYNYSFSNTSALGQYLVYGSCDENGVQTNWAYDFFVTPTGNISNIGFYIIISIILLAVLLFGVFMKIIPITILGALTLMAWGVYTMINGFDNFKNLGTEAVSICMFAFAAYWGIIAAIEFIDSN